MGSGSSLPSGIRGVKFLEEIGEGQYGKVYKAEWDGQNVAAKQLRKHLCHNCNITNNFKAERDTLFGLNHPNIVRMLHWIPPDGDIPPVLITELLYCDLQRYINSCAPIVLQEVVNFALDIAEGLRYLHERPLPIAHRDLASKNVLLTADKRAKIADLGIAKVFVCEEIATPEPGTPLYAAPETFRQSGEALSPAYGVKLDVFSLAVVLLEMITGRLPRPKPQESSYTEGGELILEHQRRQLDISEMGREHSLAGIVLRGLENDSKERPTIKEFAEELKKHKDKIDQKVGIAASGHPKLKVLALGESGTGKTCILKRYVNPLFRCEQVTYTVGYPTYTSMGSYNGIDFTLEMEDTAGQERYGSIPPILFRELNAVLLVFDISDNRSYNNIPRFIQMIASHSRVPVSMVLVGNKADRKDRRVSQEKAEKFASKYAMPYIETSAKTGQNIEQLFELVVETVYNRLELKDIESYSISKDFSAAAPESFCAKLRALFGSPSQSQTHQDYHLTIR